MKDQKIGKVGFYTIFLIKVSSTTSIYRVDNGKTIMTKFKKRILNPYRDIKDFPNLSDAKEYASGKLKKYNTKREKRVSKIPKSLYLILMKEESTGNTFVKVGITAKRFIIRRFSKDYGYKGYVVESILRRIDTGDAEKLESEIKERLKKRSVLKYRPILESFSGYSECFNYIHLDEIIRIFDNVTKNVS